MKKTIILSNVLLGSLVAGGALAEGAKVGMEYDFRLSNTDNGFSKTDDFEPTGKSTVSGTAYLIAEGKFKSVDYFFYYNATGNSLDIATITKKFGPLSISVGKDFLNQGGIENETVLINTPFYSYGSGKLPLTASTHQASFVYELGKTAFTLQIANDMNKTVTTTDATGNEVTTEVAGNQEQPATLLQYTGDYGAITPRIQVVPYDKGRSMHIAVGSGYTAGPVSGYFDYITDGRKSGDETTTFNSIVFEANLALGKVNPFLKFASLDVVQPGTDVKVNSSTSDFDDNATQIGIGARFAGIDGFEPYVSVLSESQTVNNAKNEEETKSATTLSVGVYGWLL